MSEPHSDQAATPTDRPAESIAYPTNHLVAILDSSEEVKSAMAALSGSGFLESEVEVSAGKSMAHALGATTGRSGWSHLVMRFAERLGIPNDESLLKKRYEDALRNGQFVVLVLARSDERKELAARILADHGGHFITYLGRLSFEVIRP